MNNGLKKRQEIPVELTWDLTHLFANEADFLKALDELKAGTKQLEQSYQGKLASATDPDWILEAVQTLEKLLIQFDRAGTYASIAVSVDMTDDALQHQSLAFEALAAELASRLSFFESDLMMLDEVLLKEAGRRNPAYTVFFNDLLRRKKHRLTPETEKVLAALSPALSLPFTTYEQAKHADMPFQPFHAGGKDYPLSFVLYENVYQYDRDAEVRRQSFTAFSEVLRQYQNTFAAIYNGEVQKQKSLSRLRGYDSVFDYLLDEQKVDRTLYNRQIDLIMTELAPHMRRYAKLLQQAYELDEMTFADLKIALDPDYDPQMSIDGAKELIGEALAVMGTDYQQTALRAFSERWVDFAQNIGKSTGGFCASPFGVHGYILLSWTERLSEVFTLAHEIGHAMHFILAQANQPYLACEPSLYFTEAPSTINEMLLASALLKKQTEPRMKRWVLSSLIQNTYFHNFVTHLLEAAFQRDVYQRVDQGEQLQAADLNAIKRDVLQSFWGDAVTINEGAELTWMRQPHYYMGLYPYTYSAGLTLATVASKAMETEGGQAVQSWLKALKAGGSVDPLGFARLAGVAIETDVPLRETIASIGSIIDQISQLSGD